MFLLHIYKFNETEIERLESKIDDMNKEMKLMSIEIKRLGMSSSELLAYDAIVFTREVVRTFRQIKNKPNPKPFNTDWKDVKRTGDDIIEERNKTTHGDKFKGNTIDDGMIDDYCGAAARKISSGNEQKRKAARMALEYMCASIRATYKSVRLVDN